MSASCTAVWVHPFGHYLTRTRIRIARYAASLTDFNPTIRSAAMRLTVRIIHISVLAIGWSTTCFGQVQFKPYDAVQSASFARFEDVVSRAALVEATLSQPDKDATSHQEGISIATLKAFAGDPTMEIQSVKEPISASYYQMNALMIAAESQFRNGHDDQGRALLSKAMDQSTHVFQSGYTTGPTYRITVDILARNGGISEINSIVSAIPKDANGQPDVLRDAVRAEACVALLSVDQPESAIKFAGEINPSSSGGDSAFIAFSALGDWYKNHQDGNRAIDFYEKAMACQGNSPSSNFGIRVLDKLAELQAWDAITGFLQHPSGNDPSFAGRAELHVITLLIQQDQLKRAELLAATIVNPPQFANQPSAAVASWLKIADYYSAHASAIGCDAAIQSAKHAAAALSVTGEQHYWVQITTGFSERCAETIRIALAQAKLQSPQSALSTLSDLSDFIAANPPDPVGDQIGQGGSRQDVVGLRDQAYSKLAQAYETLSNPELAKSTVGKITNQFTRQTATQALDSMSGTRIRRRSPRTVDMRARDIRPQIENCCKSGDAPQAVALLQSLAPATRDPQTVLLVAYTCIRADEELLMSKALSLGTPLPASELAFLGVLCGDSGDLKTASSLLQQISATDRLQASDVGQALEYGDPPFHEFVLLLRARVGDRQVLADAIHKAMMPPVTVQPATLTAQQFPNARPIAQQPNYGELAQILGTAGATKEDLSWIEKLPARNQVLALEAAAEGYLETMTHQPAEDRRYEFRQSGFN